MINGSKFSGFAGALSRAEMKMVKGGSGCGWSGGAGGQPVCNISQEAAMSYQASGGGYWCCTSCPNTSYCGEQQTT